MNYAVDVSIENVPEETGDNGRPKVLVVDDIRANIIAIEHVLSDLDIDLITTTDPYEALTFTFKYDFALALMDVQMPKLDGYQAAEMMQSAEHSKQIPIVFVTANSTEESNVIHGYDVGAVDYITKPLNPYILKSKVNVFVDLYNSRTALKNANKKLEDLRLLAEGASQLKSELLASMSHALRTPMHSIIGMTDMGVINIDKWDKPKQIDNLRDINKQSRVLLLLLNDIIDLSKLEAGLMKFDFSINDMLMLVHDVIKSLKPLMHEKGISINVECSHDSVMAEFDVARIGQVLLNLLSNGLKASPQNGTINLVISENVDSNSGEESVRITIADNGPGIPPELTDVIFKKFTKGDEQDNVLSSAGLGLAICKEIVDRHGGEIWVENDSDRGAVFSFDLPTSQNT